MPPQATPPADERTLTELDRARIGTLLRRTGTTEANREMLEELLALADEVPSRQVDADVVTMYSQVQIEDPQGGNPRTLAVCYPEEADADAGRVSVLSPIGAALLGLRIGASARWNTPDGKAHSARVTGIAFQPEASGDYTR